MITATGDASGLDQFIGVFARATGIKSDQAVNYQTGLLMNDIAKEAPPKTLAKAERKAKWQVRKSFYAVKRGDDIKEFGGSKPLFTKGQSKGKDTRWLWASPNFLVGTEKKNDKTGVSASQMMAMHKLQQARTGQRWIEKGKRGKQRVVIVSKPVVKATQAKAFAKKIRDTYGKLKASFLKGAGIVRAKVSLPNFVKKHLTDSKGGFIPVAPGPNPFTVIISRSPGCEHPQMQRIVRAAVKKRFFAMKKDIELYYRGIKSASDFRKKHGFNLILGSLLYFATMPSATALVGFNERISDNQSLAAVRLNLCEQSAELFHVADNSKFNRFQSEDFSGGHSLRPVAFNLWKIESDKLNLVRPFIEFNRDFCSLEFPTACPDFAVHMNTFWHDAGNSFRNGNDFSTARPEIEAVPVSSAPVQFLAEIPSSNVLKPVMVSQQRHFFFVHDAECKSGFETYQYFFR